MDVEGCCLRGALELGAGWFRLVPLARESGSQWFEQWLGSRRAGSCKSFKKRCRVSKTHPRAVPDYRTANSGRLAVVVAGRVRWRNWFRAGWRSHDQNIWMASEDSVMNQSKLPSALELLGQRRAVRRLAGRGRQWVCCCLASSTVAPVLCSLQQCRWSAAADLFSCSVAQLAQ